MRRLWRWQRLAFRVDGNSQAERFDGVSHGVDIGYAKPEVLPNLDRLPDPDRTATRVEHQLRIKRNLEFDDGSRADRKDGVERHLTFRQNNAQ